MKKEEKETRRDGKKKRKVEKKPGAREAPKRLESTNQPSGLFN